MTLDELWLTKYLEVKRFIETNHRNPSKYAPEERGRYVNWLRHNRKLLNTGELKPERVENLRHLLAMMKEVKRVNQYE